MKKLVLLLTAIGLAGAVLAGTTINDTDKYAYSANSGWINFQGNLADGAVIGEFVCSNYIYGANVGWIHLGDGAPTNGQQYLNLSADDYGVNHNSRGALRGYAYGANIGWINFEDTGAPGVNLMTGGFTGFVYSANAGWISLSNTQAMVATDSFDEGSDSDANGLPDSWELKYTNGIGLLASGVDTDGDGADDDDEYYADTDPTDPADVLVITSIEMLSATNISITWTSEQTRHYDVQENANLTNDAGWADSAVGRQQPDADADTDGTVPVTGQTQLFYRVQAVRPLAP